MEVGNGDKTMHKEIKQEMEFAQIDDAPVS